MWQKRPCMRVFPVKSQQASTSDNKLAPVPVSEYLSAILHQLEIQNSLYISVF